MAVNEFELIRRYFSNRQAPDPDTVVDLGDDAAVLALPRGQQLVISMDTLNSGVHFPESSSASDIAFKALAVNLSDVAAMGAAPAFFTLSLSLPQTDADWLQAFSDALFSLAGEAGIRLVGGDTTRGPLSVSIAVHAYVPSGQAITRSGARPGDVVCVSGTLGDAALGLQLLQGKLGADAKTKDYLVQRLQRPQPRLALGQALRGQASAMIDLSDGLLADLGKLAAASGVGADIELSRLPLSAAARDCAREDVLSQAALAGGDDYELCFTLPEQQLPSVLALARQLALPLTPVGHIKAEPGVRCLRDDGSVYELENSGYEHFS